MSTAGIRVLHFVGGRLSGGAARGAKVLSDELRRQGVNSSVLCADPTVDDGEDGVYSVATGPWARTGHFFRSQYEARPNFGRRSTDRGIFSPGRSGVNLNRHPAFKDANVIHLHWINGGLLSIEGVGRIDKPLIWTLRDMWPFTGGCHYALDCTGYTQSCGACPHLHSLKSDDLSARVLARKKKALRSETTYVGISSWISDTAKSSSLLSESDIRTISNCIDTSVFHQTSREEARARLNLPQSARIVLCGALSNDDRYKGQALLQQARKMIPENDICFAGFGARKHGEDTDFEFGLVTDDHKLRDIYAASDVLVFPSIQEAFGKVPAEAMACGTPVVAFAATGLKDIVSHETTGYAARPFDPTDLAAGIEWCLEDRQRLERLSHNAANDAHMRFAPILAAQAYINLYREKLSYAGPR